MPRRRKSTSNNQSQTYNTEMSQQATTGPAQGYENAVEPTHNGNFAWNGQPIPEFKSYGQGGQGSGQSAVTQSGNAVGTTQSSYGQSAGVWTGNATGATQSSYGQSAGAWTGNTTGTTQSSSSQPAGVWTGNAAGMTQSSYGQSAGAWTGNAAGMTQSSYGQSAQPQSFMPQARNIGGQTFQGGMPVPGSSGDPNAEYGSRNTGINNADARDVGFQGGYTGYGPNGQPVQYGTFMRDGTQYGKGPHTIDPNKAIIQAVRYNGGGISAVKFQDGSVADIATAIGMAEAGLIEDVNTGKNREGQKTLRSYPDGDPSNNLSNLPRF
ncbi:DUF3892 domain-containing protein [Paenibacillus allorhizosphaerae]|uniref:DUF3892 domain-containing protein n=1 Tax=Paenibacillus allorhizosphaerae TaxID=2849866 RepID=A0ABM8VFW5_9BACL|nr:DUF3892 domain-containing protein [Paenibacillus allorhizosphaerae]CAG7636182.1 hypothetical protein PAECIP111802_02227 [Paenibacillus allorhizosphaerae]